MTNFLQLLVTGATNGSLYVLLGLGWVLVYRVSGLIFLVAGEFAVIGGLTAITLVGSGASLLTGVVMGILGAISVAVIIEFGILRRLPDLSHSSSVLLMIGLALLISDLQRRIFGAEARGLKPFLSRAPIDVGGVAILPHQLLLIGVTVFFTVALWILLRRTMLGKAMEACSQSTIGAMVCGISVHTMRLASMVIAAVIGSIGGILVAPVIPISFSSGLNLSIMGFVAAALGLWSLPGAVTAALALGWLQALGTGYVSSAYEQVFGQVAILVALVAATLPKTPALVRRRLNSA